MVGYETVGANPCVRPWKLQTNMNTHGNQGQTRGSAPTGYKYHRRSLRLKHYDYSRAGYYFITIVAQNREHLFGEIVNDVMILGEGGRMVKAWYMKLEKKFPNIKNHEMVIMAIFPNLEIEIQPST